MTVNQAEYARLFEPLFTVAQISNASDVNVHTIRQWYKRGKLELGEHDRGAASKGHARHLSGATAMMIAIMGVLITFDVKPDIAEAAARKFVHAGDDCRKPCCLFPDGETYLVLGKEHASIMNSTANTLLQETLNLYRRSLQSKHGLRFFPMDELVITVGELLGFDRKIFWG
jgi:hypothetical protein